MTSSTFLFLFLFVILLGQLSKTTKAKSLNWEERRNSDIGRECRGVLCQHSPLNEVTKESKETETNVNDGSKPFRLYDMILTKDQVDEMRRRGKDKLYGKTRRWKRSSKSAFQFWTLPIPYMFDGYQTELQKQIIRDALQHWMDNTCVRFTETTLDQDTYDHHHILFTRYPQGCFSYTGMINAIPQQVNLEDDCLETFGKPVHEIGHVLGLWHEQQRTDRDEMIRVEEKNIGLYKNQFASHWDVPKDVPYEFGSVMHYKSKDGSINGGMTLIANDPLYQRNMGQRTGLSFSDAKYVNMIYCKDVCPDRLQRPCEHAGYQDPNFCHRCKCPDGFSGDFCEDIAKPLNADCGGVIEVSDVKVMTIETPGYDDDTKSYKSHTSCTWWFKAHINYKIRIEFLDEFGVYCLEDSCYHWVEVRYGRNLAVEGPRFCCNSRPNITITSESNEAMIIFRSNWTVSGDGSLRGFRARIIAVPAAQSETAKPTIVITTTRKSPTMSAYSTVTSSFPTNPPDLDSSRVTTDFFSDVTATVNVINPFTVNNNVTASSMVS